MSGIEKIHLDLTNYNWNGPDGGLIVTFGNEELTDYVDSISDVVSVIRTATDGGAVFDYSTNVVFSYVYSVDDYEVEDMVSVKLGSISDSNRVVDTILYKCSAEPHIKHMLSSFLSLVVRNYEAQKKDRRLDPELQYELRAAFGSGVKVVDVLTGKVVGIS